MFRLPNFQTVDSGKVRNYFGESHGYREFHNQISKKQELIQGMYKRKCLTTYGEKTVTSWSALANMMEVFWLFGMVSCAFLLYIPCVNSFVTYIYEIPYIRLLLRQTAIIILHFLHESFSIFHCYILPTLMLSEEAGQSWKLSMRHEVQDPY